MVLNSNNYKEELYKVHRCKSMINYSGISDDEKKALKMKMEKCLTAMNKRSS